MAPLFAHLHEGWIALGLVAVVAGLTLPLFEKFGFGGLASLGWSIGSGVLAVIGLALWGRVAERLESRRKIRDWFKRRRRMKLNKAEQETRANRTIGPPKEEA
jgi:hypothetical protein